MWKTVRNGDSNKPDSLDIVSSRKWNYIRKNFELIPEKEIDGYIDNEHWQWEEKKILKEDWDTYMQLAEHDTALDDVYTALTELANIIVEG